MICYEEKDRKFNFRMSAIILDLKEESLLIHKIAGNDFWLLPGGRAEILENTEGTIIRELKEELGIIVSNPKLALVSENFFNFNGKTYHELGFTYIIKLLENSSLLLREGEFKGKEGANYIFKWHNINKIYELNFKPKFLIPEIETANIKKEIQHIIIDER